MAVLPKWTYTDWRQPYHAVWVPGETRRTEDGLVVDGEMTVTLRYWHPRLWWMFLKALIRGED